jgi:precorrin-2 dehydrogenase / sirohydrochlorin ferrochelatase
MFPVALDLSRLIVLLVGEGDLLARRLRQLDEAGAAQVISKPWEEVSDIEFHSAHIVMVAGLDSNTSRTIAQRARAAGKLVNVEDVVELCDFFFTANVRRGDLLISVSTHGTSPTLARRVRDYIATRFGPEWEGFSREIAQHRQTLKQAGKSMKEVLHESDSFLHKKGWLSCTRCPKNTEDEKA